MSYTTEVLENTLFIYYVFINDCQILLLMIKKEYQIPASDVNAKPISYDIRFQENGIPKPIVLFVHGFKGFKDWGHFNLLADAIAGAGYVFVKMNFSHNGTTPENLLDFVDLEAFGNNNYSQELDDLGTMIDHISSEHFEVLQTEVDTANLTLIGHSRGGGATILKTKEDQRVKKLITWASIQDHNRRWPNKDLKAWKEKGVHHILNGRTNQLMPMYYQIVENYFANEARLNIPNAVKAISVPFLAIHGSLDETVPKEVLQEFKALNPGITIELMAKAGHTFGGKHPYDQLELSRIGKMLVEKTLNFLNS